MSESDPDPKHSGDVPAPLDPLPYATPTPRTNPGMVPVKERWAIGCFGYILISIGWFASAPFLQSLGYRHGVPVGDAFLGWMLMTAVLLALTLFLRLRYGFKGYGYGILSALGAGALILLGLFLLLLAICASHH